MHWDAVVCRVISPLWVSHGHPWLPLSSAPVKADTCRSSWKLKDPWWGKLTLSLTFLCLSSLLSPPDRRKNSTFYVCLPHFSALCCMVLDISPLWCHKDRCYLSLVLQTMCFFCPTLFLSSSMHLVGSTSINFSRKLKLEVFFLQ